MNAVMNRWDPGEKPKSRGGGKKVPAWRGGPGSALRVEGIDELARGLAVLAWLCPAATLALGRLEDSLHPTPRLVAIYSSRALVRVLQLSTPRVPSRHHGIPDNAQRQRQRRRAASPRPSCPSSPSSLSPSSPSSASAAGSRVRAEDKENDYGVVIGIDLGTTYFLCRVSSVLCHSRRQA